MTLTSSIQSTTTPTFPELETDTGSLLSILRNLLMSGDVAVISDLNAAEQDELILLADVHGLTPFLIPLLRHSEDTRVAELYAQLAERQNHKTRRTMAMAAETLRLLKVIQTRGVEVIAFKGCALAQVVYGNIAMRNSCDIDLFVADEDKRLAIEILKSEGYQLAPQWDSRMLEGHLRFDCECSLHHPQRAITIDLHWEFSAKNYSLQVPVKDILSRTQETSFLGQVIKTFCPEDLLLILCLHASKQCWLKLEWSYTLSAYIASHPAIDWHSLMNSAEEMRLGQITTTGLLLAKFWFGAPLPPEVLALIEKDHNAVAMATTVMAWVDRGVHYSPSPLAVRIFHSRGRSSSWRKMVYWWHVIMTPTEKEYQLPLNPSWWRLYYPVRLIRLSGEPFHYLKSKFFH